MGTRFERLHLKEEPGANTRLKSTLKVAPGQEEGERSLTGETTVSLSC
jgi:hypothetical protein